jgi:hypothetical protein
MTTTTVELRESVAEHLRLKSVDVDLDADTAAKIDRYISMVTNMERQKGLIWWVDNAIPDQCKMPMMLMVAAIGCVGFGKSGQGYESGYSDGKAQLASLKPSAVIETIAGTYF